jgi:(S)-2-hydroxyglutarate dehydrogenase
MKSYDYAIIGGGIVGLSTALALGRAQARARILVLEKETGLARHQTGRNSGVIHSGIYYKPGSLKAQFARSGSRSMAEFCQTHGLAHEICGKVIVATESEELFRLEALAQRGLEHGLAVARLSPEQVREIEPHVQCLGGLRVPSTGIVSYTEVCLKMAELIRQTGGMIELGAPVVHILNQGAPQRLVTPTAEYETRFLINCAGLHSDRVARLAGVDPGARIVPFRGEYYELAPEKRTLVRNLVYPVPNPDFPFL